MFRRTTVICLSGFGLLVAFWIFQFCVVRSTDYEKYTSFVQQRELASSSNSVSSSTHQKRYGVRKDIWFAQEDGSRLHYQIESESSILTLLPGKKFDIIENLEKMKCWMQDKLYLSSNAQPIQQMRYFEADHGTYQYTTQQFVAQAVALSLFRLPGHALPVKYDSKSAFLRGIAQDVSFSVSGKTPQFQAQNFKAILKQSNEG